MSAGATIDLAALEALCDAATPGPWNAQAVVGYRGSLFDVRQGVAVGVAGSIHDPANATFIAAAHPSTVSELIRLARIGQQAGAAQPVATQATVDLYAAVNKLVAHIGMHGQVDSRHELVDGVMQALYSLDGGWVGNRVEDLIEKAFMPRGQAVSLSVRELCSIATPVAAPAQPVAVPAGWKLMPEKITEKMHVAAVRAIINATGNDDCPPAVLAALFAAAPTPPTAQAGELIPASELTKCRHCGFRVKLNEAPVDTAQAGEEAVLQMELALYRDAYGPQAPTEAVIDVLAERQRQVSGEGWTPERDDTYRDCELARAAATYALCERTDQIKVCDAPVWPWPLHWWKPTTYRRNIVKAAALLIAEIERVDRAEQPADGEAAKPLTRCAAGRDGECGHKDCPQLRDGEPAKSGRHCLLDGDQSEVAK